MEKKKKLFGVPLKSIKLKTLPRSNLQTMISVESTGKINRFFRQNGGKLSIMLVFLSILSFRTT